MIDKLIEQQETIKGMQENEESAIKIMKMYEDYKLRVDRAIEYIENMTKQFESFKDKELITNRVIDISVLEKILKILDKGDEK